MDMAYKGKYRPKRPEKYMGDHTNIVYRSLWERKVFEWCDENPQVEGWNSEEVVIPYACKTDGKWHRYFMDVMIKFTSGAVVLVEIKPKKQRVPPKQPQKKTRKYLKECMTYIKNSSKWEAAKEYAEDRGWSFQIWDEDTLKKIGIRMPNYGSKPKKKVNS